MKNEVERETKTQPKLAWPLDEAAAATGLSKGFFRKIIANGELRATRAGRRVLIRDSDLRAWLDQNVQEAPGQG